MQTIAIVGAGLIGSGWATLFGAAGKTVRIFDADAATRDAAPERIAANLAELREAGTGPAANAPDITVCDTLADAVAGADYVQESVLERTHIKQAVCTEIAAALAPHALVGSSSSGIPASDFTGDLPGRERFFIVHPVNPPHLIPLVEIVPAPWSDKAHIPAIRALMEEIGQEPVTVEREIEGFILNRLQGALLNEAWALYADGYASAADIDRTVSAGLGLRWSLMGPFDTIDLNAPDGVADYAERLQPLYHRIAQSRRDPQPWPADAIARAKAELPAADTRAARTAARDRWLLALKKLKATS